MTMLIYHINNTDVNEKATFVRQSHASSLINLIQAVCTHNKELTNPYVEIITGTAVKKWFTQLELLQQTLVRSDDV